jgi:hypothetical protein
VPKASRGVLPIAGKSRRKPTRAQVYAGDLSDNLYNEWKSGGSKEPWILYLNRRGRELYNNATEDEKKEVDKRWAKTAGARKKGVKLEIDAEGLTPEEFAEKQRIAIAQEKEA